MTRRKSLLEPRKISTDYRRLGDNFADFCINIFENLGGIDNFLGKYCAPKLAHQK